MSSPRSTPRTAAQDEFGAIDKHLDAVKLKVGASALGGDAPEVTPVMICEHWSSPLI
jgi:hypothetical protein